LGRSFFRRGQRPVLTRGRRMVQAEWSLCALAYNLTRVINLLSVPELVKALQMRRRGGLAGAGGGAFVGATRRGGRSGRRFGACEVSLGKVFAESMPLALWAAGGDDARTAFPHSLTVSSRAKNCSARVTIVLFVAIHCGATGCPIGRIAYACRKSPCSRDRDCGRCRYRSPRSRNSIL
jgi:hypothetical protein